MLVVWWVGGLVGWLVGGLVGGLSRWRVIYLILGSIPNSAGTMVLWFSSSLVGWLISPHLLRTS